MSVPVNTWDVSLVLVAAALGGLLVASLSTRSMRSYVSGVETTESSRAMLHLVGGLREGIPVDEAWRDLMKASAGTLGRLEVRLVTDGGADRPVVRRGQGWRGQADANDTLVVPRAGAVLPMAEAGPGRALVVVPRDGLGSVEVSRSALVSFAEHMEWMARSGLLV